MAGLFPAILYAQEAPKSKNTLTKKERDILEIPQRKERGRDPKERAKFGIETFEAGCFLKFWNTDELFEWANTYFSPLPSSNKLSQAYFKMIHISDAKIWDAIFPEGKITIILEDNGTCHTIIHGAEENVFHKEMEKFAQKAMKRLQEKKVSYNYDQIQKTEEPDHFLSTIQIIQPDNGNTVSILATTIERGNEIQPNAIITIKH